MVCVCAMRLITKLVFVVCLLLLACFRADAVGRLSFLMTTPIDITAKKKSQVEEEALRHEYHCRSKGLHFCNLGKNNITTNTTSQEDKRVVPTGSNPLHNR